MADERETKREASKPAAYQIATYGMGMVGVKGRVLGLFGVHREGGYWTVTHIPTGYACRTGLSKMKALELQREFHESPVDWSFSNPKKAPKKTQAWAKQAVKKYDEARK